MLNYLPQTRERLIYFSWPHNVKGEHKKTKIKFAQDKSKTRPQRIFSLILQFMNDVSFREKPNAYTTPTNSHYNVTKFC